MSVERVKRLSCWKSPAVEVEPLAGGITNQNYLVRDQDQRFVVRQCANGELLGIDRRNERNCHRAAADIGVSPDLVHHEQEFLVSNFVAGRTLTVDELQQPDCLVRVARALRQLHDAWSDLTGEMVYFSAFQSIRSYAQTASQRGAQLPSNLHLILADVCALEASIAPFRPVLCHNDLLPANLIDTGERVWLIDWELAGIGHPTFDLGGLSSNAGLSAELNEVLLTAYRANATERRELQIFQAMSLLREALWGAVQSVSSQLTVDYQAYAETHFARYREARALIR